MSLERFFGRLHGGIDRLENITLSLLVRWAELVEAVGEINLDDLDEPSRIQKIDYITEVYKRHFDVDPSAAFAIAMDNISDEDLDDLYRAVQEYDK